MVHENVLKSLTLQESSKLNRYDKSKGSRDTHFYTFALKIIEGSEAKISSSILHVFPVILMLGRFLSKTGRMEGNGS